MISMVDRIVALFAIAWLLFVPAESRSETSIRSERVEVVLRQIWHSEFASAVDSCYRLVSVESSNPVGYFLLGVLYYSISSQFRTDRFVDSVNGNLDQAIKLASKLSERSDSTAEPYFVLGSAYGCRALFRSMHGGWWGAFRDGHHSCANLEKAFERDTTLTDALSGIGAYHYWKSVKSKKVAWLPFISDKRTQGLSEIARAIAAGGMMSPNARKAMLPIYCYESKFEEALVLADSLEADSLLDANCRLHAIRALIEQKRWDEANRELREVQVNWESSIYADTCAFSELQYLKAKILLKQGNTEGARLLIRSLLSLDAQCKSSTYYRDTQSKARSLKLKGLN